MYATVKRFFKLIAGALVLIWVAGLQAVQGQNLLPNPSFEQYTVCPLGPGVNPWDQPTAGNPGPTGWINPSYATPDYFHRCSQLPFPFPLPGLTAPVDVPVNAIGIQEPRTGDAYVGIIGFSGLSGSLDDGWREYWQVRLNQPLVPGQQYEFRMYVNLGEYVLWAGNVFGLHFDTVQRTHNDSTPMPLTPQFQFNNVVNDRVNWVPVCTTFTAPAAWEWLIIGNFRPVGSTTIQSASGPTTPPPAGGGGNPLPPISQPYAYYFIDDVYLGLANTVPLPPPTASNDTLICAGETVTLRGFFGDSYSWSTGATTASLTVSPAATTTYTVRITQGCTEVVETVVVTVDPCLTLRAILTLNNDSLCAGECATLTASALGGTAPYTYTWLTGGLTGPGPHNLCALPAGTNVFVVEVRDAVGLTDTDSVAITVTAAPLPVFSNDTLICAGETVTLFGANGTSYSWSTGATTPFITVSPTNTTTYTVTAPSPCGTRTRNIIVTVDPCLPLNVDLGVNLDTLCLGQCVDLTPNVTGGRPPLTYTWLQGGLTGPGPFNLCNLPAGLNTFELLVVDSQGNRDSATVSVFVWPAFSVTARADTFLCAPGPVTLTATSSLGTPITWFVETAFTVYPGLVVGPNPAVVTPTQTTRYFAQAFTPDDRCDVLDTVVVTVDSITAAFEVLPNDTANAPLIAQFVNNSQNATRYFWRFTPNPQDTSAQASPTFTYNAPGSYTVLLIARNGTCTDTAVRTVRVNTAEQYIYIPNVFTPNGDNLNDQFVYLFSGYDRVCARVFDRWGTQVYSNDCAGTQFWNGKVRNADAPEGVYVYQIEFRNTITGAKAERTGTVTLLR